VPRPGAADPGEPASAMADLVGQAQVRGEQARGLVKCSLWTANFGVTKKLPPGNVKVSVLLAFSTSVPAAVKAP
jgi:hypothetical protein